MYNINWRGMFLYKEFAMRHLIHRVISAFVFSIVFLMNVSCPQEGGFNAFVAVGREVDQTPPKISITSPKNGEYLPRGDLSLNGIASDNIAVTRIVVTMTIKIDGKDEVLTTETSQFDGDMWSVTFTEQQAEKLGVFNTNGAKVTFTASAYDAQQNSGPESTDSRFIYIDTTQPEIAWQKPTPVNRFYDTDYNLYKNDLVTLIF